MIISCPSCEKRLRVPDELMGQDRVVKCPGCSGVDGVNKVRVAGLFTVTPTSSSRKWQSNVSQPGGLPGPRRGKRKPDR